MTSNVILTFDKIAQREYNKYQSFICYKKVCHLKSSSNHTSGMNGLNVVSSSLGLIIQALGFND